MFNYYSGNDVTANKTMFNLITFENVIIELFVYIYIYIYMCVCVCVCQHNLALNNLLVFICHKRQPNQSVIEIVRVYIYMFNNKS